MTKQTSTKAAGQETPTLRQRAAQARDAAGRFLRRAVGQHAGQPEPASLPGETAAESSSDAFPVSGTTPHDAGRGQPDGSGRADAARGQKPRQGQDMGRHETFGNAAPIDAELMAGTSLGRLSSPLPPEEVGPQEAAFLAVIPKALPILRRLIPAQAETTRLDVEADAVAGGYPGLTDEGRRRAWADRASDARNANGFSAAWQVASDLDDKLTAVVANFDLVPTRSPTAILFKAALNDLGEWWGESATADLRRLAAARFGLPASNDPTAIDRAASEGPAEPVAKSEAVDWNDPPPGFMASPAIEPMNFVRVETGIRIEANRLLGIALAEQRRRQTMGIDGHSKPWDAEDDARTRRALHLDALSAIACPGMIEVAGIRYVPEDQHTKALREHRLIAGGIHHDDGTVTYLDAAGAAWTSPTAHWIAFVAMQLNHRARAEMARQRMGQGDMTGDAIEAHEAQMRRELRTDAISDLAFHHLRAFKAAEALQTGAEPRDAEMRARDDADLLTLAPQWQAARDLFARRNAEQSAVEIAARDTRSGPAPAGSGEEWQAWYARSAEWRERTGVEAAEDASGEACVALGAIEDRIAGLSAASLAGLQLKARVAQRCDDDEIEWPDGLGAGLARDILAFTGPAIGRPDLTDPDVLTAAILAHWPEWARYDGREETPEAEAAWTRNDERRNALLDAAEALPANKRAIVAKALACSWVTWVDAERVGQPRAEHSFTGRLTFDIHAAVTDRPVPETWARQPLERTGPRIVDRIDFTALSLEELRVLHDTADMVGGVAYATAWQGRCHRRGTPVHLGVMNAAGDLMHWLGDALTEVESKAIREAERRQPASQDDRAIRLELVAPGIIQNGDPEEIAAFARELSEHAVAEASGT